IVKNVLKLSFAFVVLVAAMAGARVGDTPTKTDGAYLQMKKMVGGVWHSKANGADVGSHCRFGAAGTSLLTDTIIDPKGKLVHLMARFGWDAAAKQVYYLDAHGFDTVYFGHVTTDGKDLVMKFKGLVGDTGEYIFRITFTNDDEFHATLFLVKD